MQPVQDLNQLLIFSKVVEAGSISGAARLLQMPKASVSRKLAQLEEQLGVRLAQRNTRSLQLTDAGLHYHDQVSRLLGELTDATLRLTQMQAEPTGLLRLTAPVIFGDRFLGDLLVEYMQRYPQVRVEVLLTDQLVDLVEQGIDVGIRAGQVQDNSYIARRLGPTLPLTVASPAYVARQGQPQHPRELLQHQIIGYLGKHKQVLYLGPNQQQLALELPNVLAVNHLNLMRSACLAGLGITVLPSFLCQDEVRQGRLLSLLPDWQCQFGDVYAIYPSRRQLSAKVRAFVDLAIERLSSSPPWLPEAF